MKKIFNILYKHLGVVCAVFVVISIAFGLYLFMTSPKIKFMRLVDKEYKSFAEFLNQAKENELASLGENETLTSTGDVKFNLSLDSETFGNQFDALVDVINGLTINYEYGTDSKNKNTYAKLDSNINDKDFIDVDIYQKGDKQYIYLKDVYEKYIENKSSDLINTEGNKTEDMLYLVNKIKKSFVESLKKSDFTGTKKEVDVNGVLINADKITLKLTDSRMKEIIKKILTDLKNDDRALEFIKEMSTNDEDIKKSLEEAISEVDKEKILEEDIMFDIYIENDSIIKMDIFEGKSKYVEYQSYFDFSNVKEITIFSDEEEVMSAKFEKKSVNDMGYEISIGKDVIFANGTISKRLQENTVDGTVDLSVSFNLVLSYANSVLGSLKFEANSYTKAGDNIDMPSTFDSVDIDDLTEEESSDISEKLITKIFDAFPELPINDPIEMDDEIETY